MLKLTKYSGFVSVKDKDLIALGKNSSIALIYYYTNGLRCGGISSLLPYPPAIKIGKLLENLVRQPAPERFFIIGGIEFWNDNWEYIPQAKDLTFNGKCIKQISDIPQALNIPVKKVFNKNFTDEKLRHILFRPNGTYNIREA